MAGSWGGEGETMPSVLIAFPLIVLYGLAAWLCGAAAVGIAVAGVALFGVVTHLALRPGPDQATLGAPLQPARRIG